jgi:hypothetical protein
MEVRWRNANRYDKARRSKRQISYPWHPGVVFIGMRQPYPWAVVMSPASVRYVISNTPARPRKTCVDEIGRLIRLKDGGRFVRPDHRRWRATGGEFDPGDTVLVTAARRPPASRRGNQRAGGDGVRRVLRRPARVRDPGRERRARGLRAPRAASLLAPAGQQHGGNRR